MSLNVTMDKETINYNKAANIKDANGNIVGILSYSTTNQEYSGINFNVNISNKEEFIKNAETYKSDIVSFLDAFIAKTNAINADDTVE